MSSTTMSDCHICLMCAEIERCKPGAAGCKCWATPYAYFGGWDGVPYAMNRYDKPSNQHSLTPNWQIKFAGIVRCYTVGTKQLTDMRTAGCTAYVGPLYDSTLCSCHPGLVSPVYLVILTGLYRPPLHSRYSTSGEAVSRARVLAVRPSWAACRRIKTTRGLVSRENRISIRCTT